MKKFLSRSVFAALLAFLLTSLKAQTGFQASFTYSGNTISFKIKPNRDYTNLGFSVIEFFVRVPDTKTFSWGTVVANTTNFPGSNGIAPNGWVNESLTQPGYKVSHFYYTAPAPITTLRSYSNGQEYEVFNITVDVNPATLSMELVHSPVTEDPYYLAITDNFGGDLRALPESNFFYPTTNTSGNPYFLGLTAALPSIFGDFNVNKQGTGNALLNWSTRSEQNVNYYVVERSTAQNSSWTAIGQVKAVGNSTSTSKYSFTDQNVYDGRSASKVVFYRIKSVDLDGKESYFPVRSLRFSATGEKDISIYPNPASQGFYLSIPLVSPQPDKKIRLNMVNRLGQLVHAREINSMMAANYYYDIKTPGIINGEYMLQIILDGELLDTKKVIVQQ